MFVLELSFIVISIVVIDKPATRPSAGRPNPHPAKGRAQGWWRYATTDTQRSQLPVQCANQASRDARPSPTDTKMRPGRFPVLAWSGQRVLFYRNRNITLIGGPKEKGG